MFLIFAVIFAFCAIALGIYNLTILYSIGIMIQAEGFVAMNLHIFVGSFLQNVCIAGILFILAHICQGISSVLEKHK